MTLIPVGDVVGRLEAVPGLGAGGLGAPLTAGVGKVDSVASMQTAARR